MCRRPWRSCSRNNLITGLTHCRPGRRDSVRRQIKRRSPPLPRPISRHEEKSVAQFISNPLPKVGEAHKDIRQRTTFNLPSNGSDVTLAEIEHFYEIGHVVGDGNFAVVRKCRRRDDGQTLAVKIVERSKLIGREHMMQNELSLLGSLCHPRIVRLFSHHHTHTHSYLVMELVGGGDLFEAISERGTFPEAESGLMVSDVSEALNYMHCKSIVHRDLKPENLLVSIEHVAPSISRLKLGDFGLAMVVTEPVFTICGTPTYVAPEILRETGYGVAVDVWALGIILYILLCGFAPFRSQDRDQEELFQLIKQGQLHFLSPYWDAVSEDATGLVRALLEPDPAVRLTAEQTMTHPWVKASICRQRALAEKTWRDKADTGAEPDKPGLVQRPAQTNAAKRGRNQNKTDNRLHFQNPPPNQNHGGPLHATPPVLQPSSFFISPAPSAKPHVCPSRPRHSRRRKPSNPTTGAQLLHRRHPATRPVCTPLSISGLTA
uniref:Doublecortin-like kinase 3 n=1 Tax=Gasterosteus aculeatus aculeatus TaxID=481459 RepID=A0AAQ4S4U1_GASAC